MEANKVPSVLV